MCRELISKEVGIWLISSSKVSWPKGRPPKLQLEQAGKQTFKVTPVKEP